MKQKRAATNGFTLLEALMSLSFFIVVLMAVYMVFETSTATYNRGTRLQDVQQMARLALDEMSNQIRMANYYPELFDTTPPGTPGCPNGTVGPCDTTSFPIQVATPTTLAVFGNLDGFRDGTTNNLQSRVFLYCLNGQQLIAKVTLFSATQNTPYTCTANTGDALATNVLSLTFEYFDANGAQIGAGAALDGQAVNAVFDPTNMAQRGAVRKVLITLRVSEQRNAKVTGTQGGRSTEDFVLTSVVRLRNL